MRPRLDPRSERGFTLVELLVVIAVSVIVVGIAGGAVVNSLGHQRTQMGQVQALNEAKLAFERVTRDLRGAHRLLVAEDRQARVDITRDGEVRSATFTASASDTDGLFELTVLEEVRDQVTGLLLSTREQVLHSRLLLDAGEGLFTYITDDDGEVVAIEVALRILPSTGANEIALRNEVAMRNVTP